MTIEPARPDRQLPAGPSAAGGAVDGVVDGVSKVFGWAARTGWGLARRVPGVSVVERGLRELERVALAELRRRMDADGADSSTLLMGHSPFPGAPPVITRHGDFVPLRAATAGQLERSLSQSAAQAKDDLYAAILSQLVPDEVRILSALGDGSPFAVLDVVQRGEYLVRNASSVGRAAGVLLVDHVSVYITRLRQLALVEIGDEAPGLSHDYDILQTDSHIHDALHSGRRAKLVRRSVRISPLGAALWAACDPSTWT